MLDGLALLAEYGLETAAARPASSVQGADLVEAVARKHVWEPGRLPGYSAATQIYGR
jgi:hypothetical protein